MFDKNYYCLVAGLREYALDADTKGFDAAAIISEIKAELNGRDLKQVGLLYLYHDCENIASLRAGRSAHNPLGNLSREELEQELRSPKQLPREIREVVEAYNAPDTDEEDDNERRIDPAERSFERALFGAYYKVLEREGGRFLKAWGEFDRNLRNIAAAVTARTSGRAVSEVTVGNGRTVEQLQRSSAADFGLRGDLQYIDAVIAAVNDESNIVEKEHKMDLIRWREVQEIAFYDYFNINAILSYLVRINIVARWSRLDAVRGRKMFDRLIAELDAKELVKEVKEDK